MDLAFEWLERAYDQRDPGLCEMKAHLFAPLVCTPIPRWDPFLRKMGLAD